MDDGRWLVLPALLLPMALSAYKERGSSVRTAHRPLPPVRGALDRLAAKMVQMERRIPSVGKAKPSVRGRS